MDQPFEGKTSSHFENFSKKLDEQFNQAMPRVEEELKKVIAYLNDQVVPQVRQNSSQALHTAAERLQKLAKRLDDDSGSGAH